MNGGGPRIAVDASGNAYITGVTDSSNFPTTPGAFQTTYGGGYCGYSPCTNAFVSKLNASGSALVYSTYLRGSSNEWEWGSRHSGRCLGPRLCHRPYRFLQFPHHSGRLPDHLRWRLPTWRFLSAGSMLAARPWSTPPTWAAVTPTRANGIAVDASGNAYVTGGTFSSNFPTTPGAFQTTCGGALFREQAERQRLEASSTPARGGPGWLWHSYRYLGQRLCLSPPPPPPPPPQVGRLLHRQAESHRLAPALLHLSRRK